MNRHSRLVSAALTAALALGGCGDGGTKSGKMNPRDVAQANEAISRAAGLSGTYRADKNQQAPFTILVLENNGTFHAEAPIKPNERTRAPQLDGTFTATKDSISLVAKDSSGKPISRSLFKYTAPSVEQSSITLTPFAIKHGKPVTGKPFTLTNNGSAWCGTSTADCEHQNLITPACVGQFTCEQNACSFHCGVRVVTDGVLPIQPPGTPEPSGRRSVNTGGGAGVPRGRLPVGGVPPMRGFGEEGKACGGFLGLGCAAGKNLFCEFLAGTCGNADAPGTCTKRLGTATCPRSFIPVCGCDNHTYANECEATRGGVSKRHAGPCNDMHTPPATNPDAREGGSCGFVLNRIVKCAPEPGKEIFCIGTPHAIDAPGTCEDISKAQRCGGFVPAGVSNKCPADFECVDDPRHIPVPDAPGICVRARFSESPIDNIPASMP
jgi:hypothetical protein